MKPIRPKRANVEGVQTRNAILDATETIMREEGYAAVSSRRVAERAGLKSQLIYYHFGTMDELFLAVYRRNEEKYFEEHARAMASRRPLRALWNLGINSEGATLEIELFALANHRKNIRSEIAQSTSRFRSMQVAAISRVLEELGLPETQLPATVLAQALVSISRGLVTESTLGVNMGHETMLRYVEEKLRSFEEGESAVPQVNRTA